MVIIYVNGWQTFLWFYDKMGCVPGNSFREAVQE